MVKCAITAAFFQFNPGKTIWEFECEKPVFKPNLNAMCIYCKIEVISDFAIALYMWNWKNFAKSKFFEAQCHFACKYLGQNVNQGL